MSTSSSTKPVRTRQQVVVRRNHRGSSVSWLNLLPAALLSVLFHGGLIFGAIFLFNESSKAEPPLEKAKAPPVKADPPPPPEAKTTERFVTADDDPTAQDTDTDINFNNKNKAEVSVPGLEKPGEKIGIDGGLKDVSPFNIAATQGVGGVGQGGTIEDSLSGLSTNNIGQMGGYGLEGMPLAGSFDGRSASTREILLREGGGTEKSEAAVARGLQWLARVQSADGKWQLDGPFPDKGAANDIAGTAFGLLPFLAAGKTHKNGGKDNPFDKPILDALAFLCRRQNKKNGDFGGGMYAHGLATIAMCEAYGLSKDPNLRRPAQNAINFIIDSQNITGGWDYSPRTLRNDTSVSGWQVMALKSGQLARLDVPDITMTKAINFLDSACDDSAKGGNEGYGYVGKGSSPTMSAVGLLCRQYLQYWGPNNPRMALGVERNIKVLPPGKANNMYYYYYATQVMHHFGGKSWQNWNAAMRDQLISTQTKEGPHTGSWDASGDAHGGAGGRVMQTSLSLLTLEVYYRHLPLFKGQTSAD